MTAKPSQSNLEVHAGWQPGELERKLSLKNYLCFLQMFHYHWDHKEELIKTRTLAWQIMPKKVLCTHLEDQNGYSLLCLCKHLCAFQIELDYLSVGFWREEYQVTWRKTSTNNQEDQQQTQCSYSVTFAGHIGLRQELSPDCTPVPCSPKLHARPLVLTFVSFTYDLMLIGYNPEFK